MSCMKCPSFISTRGWLAGKWNVSAGPDAECVPIVFPLTCVVFTKRMIAKTLHSNHTVCHEYLAALTSPDDFYLSRILMRHFQN